MSNTYSYVYIGFEPTDKIILIYFQGMRIKFKTSALFFMPIVLIYFIKMIGFFILR